MVYPRNVLFQGLSTALFSSFTFKRSRAIRNRVIDRFKNPLYTIDASTIDLRLSVFPWAKFRTTKGAIKRHCLYDHSGALPTFLTITDGKKHDVRVVKDQTLPLSPDSIVSVDKAYIDYKWLNSLNEQRVWFVTRAKTNIDYAVVGQHPISSKKVL